MKKFNYSFCRIIVYTLHKKFQLNKIISFICQMLNYILVKSQNKITLNLLQRYLYPCREWERHVERQYLIFPFCRVITLAFSFEYTRICYEVDRSLNYFDA